MMKDDVEHALDLRRADLDQAVFAAALVVRHMRRLITYGGSENSRPDDDTALDPHHLERFLVRAVETAQKTKLFEHEWRSLQYIFPRMKIAWEKGQVLFRQSLARAMSNPEEMEYLSMIDFAVDCYAEIVAKNTYPQDRALQAWAINGYMLAWRQHFFTDEDNSE